MMKQMQKHILMLRSGTGVFGAERVVLEMAAALPGFGYQATVGVIENHHPGHAALADAATAMGLPSLVFPCSGPFDVKTIWRIRRYIDEHGITVVNPHGYKANFYALAANTFRDIPLTATLHPWTENDYSLRARIYTWLDKAWLGRMDRLVAVSENVCSELHQRLPGAACHVIPNGIDMQRFSLNGSFSIDTYRQACGFSATDQIIGAVGRLVPEKGYGYLLEAVAVLATRHAGLRLLIVGDGEQREQLENQAGELGISDRVHFAGVRDDIPELLEMIDIFCMTSLSEGLPMALLEAMAAGKPVVATSVGDIPNAVSTRDTGLLVAPGEPRALSEALQALLASPDSAARMGQAGRRFVTQRFGNQRMAEKYAALFNSLCGNS